MSRATGRTLRVIHGPQYVGDFSPDSTRLSTSDYAGNLEVWQPCPQCGNQNKLLALAAHRTTRSLTPAEQSAYLRDDTT